MHVTNVHGDDAGRLFVVVDRRRYYLRDATGVEQYDWVVVTIRDDCNVDVHEYLPDCGWWVPRTGERLTEGVCGV